MKPAALTLLLSLVVAAAAQEPKKETPAVPATPRPALTAAELEAKFKTALTNAVMDGRYCTVANGKLGPDKEDKYTIASVEKTGEGKWTINAKIQYGKVEFTAPVPVEVKWAGDTPVIIVDNIGFPGTAKYSARVMIFGDTYSGTWSAGDHGGLMHGIIAPVKAEEKKP